MITDFDKILNDLSYKVKDGIPDLTNEQHLIKLFDVLKEYNWPIEDRVTLIKNLVEPESITEAKGDTSATTFYHEVMTGILVGGGNSSFKDGEEVKKFFKNGTIKAVNAGLSTVKPEGSAWERFLLKASIPKSSLVSDAKNLSTRIKKELGKKFVRTGI